MMPVIARVAALHFDVRHKNHDFLGHKVAVAAIISLAAVLGFAEAPATPDFTLSASPASIRVARNAKGSAIITTAILHGFNGLVNLTAAGVPTGATASFSPSSISSPGAGSSALTISVGNSTPLGTYSVTVTGSAEGNIKSATVTLTVVPSQSLPTGYGWHQLANTNMISVCLGNVPNGMYSDPTMTTTKSYSFNCNQIEPQSGGAADDNNQRLIVWGGGHQDYAGNEVSVLNLNGTPSWQAFTSPTLPVPYGYDGNAWEGLQPYFVRAVDGGIYQPGASPSSRHTYNGVQYVPYQNKLYSFGGAVANMGYFSEETWSLDMGAKTWTLLGPPYSQAPWFPTTAYNPITGHIVMHDKNKSLLDFDPNTGNWKTLTNQYHVDDGTTAAVDPVNTLFVVVGGNSTDGTTYPSVPTSQTVQVFPLTPPYTMLTWSDPSCDLVYRDSGLAWDSALGLIVGYPGGGNQVYLLNTGAQEVVTPFGTVPSHKCLDVPISLNPSPVKGVDYPQDPESTSSGQNRGIFGRLAYLPSLDTFVMMNDRTKNVWTMQLTGGSSALSFAASTSTGALTVPEGSQGTSVISTTISGGFNNAITLSSAGAPAGTTVSFTPSTIAAPGAGSSTLTINVGASTPAGTYHIVVSAFGGGDTVNTSVTLTVTAAGQPNFTISASPPSLSIQQGNQGTSALTTTVSGGFNSAISLSASGMPTGTTVSFNPSTIPAPGGGNSTMTITVGSSTPTGTYPITVVGNGGGVQQTTTVTLTVTAGGQPNFTLSGSPPSLSIVQGNHGTSTIATTISGGFNSAISLSATGTPTGTTVSFNPSTIAAPSSGNSTMTITVGSSTPAGTYPITVTGNGAGAQQNATVTLTVTAGGKPTFTISASPTSLTIAQGNQGTSTITTAISGGFNSWISLSSSGAPSGTTVSFNPSTIPAPGAGNSTITMTVASSTPTGTYPITVTGTGGGKQHAATVNLLVTPQAAFTLSALPASLNVTQGNQGTSTLTTTISGGFNSAISLSASGVPTGTTVSFNPNPIAAPSSGNSTMTITVGSSTPAGTYPILVTGNGGGVQQNTTVTLTVITGGKANFALSASPASLSVAEGNQGTSTITTAISGGFNSSISLSASGMPSGTTVSFNPDPIPPPSAGNSTMTITIGASTPVGTYPITVSGNGGAIQQKTTVILTVTAPAYDVGIDFRSRQNYVTDPAYAVFDNCVNDGTTQQTRTNTNGYSITWQWSQNCNAATNESASIDPRLAGIASVYTASGGETLTITVPQPGTYNIGFATGMAAGNQCGGGRCPNFIFKDGASGKQLFTVNPNNPGVGDFIDAANHNWTAAQWPASNREQQVTLSGRTLTVSMAAGNAPSIAHIRITYVQPQSFTLSAAPAALSIQQGSQGTSTITTTISGGFNSAISLSASGVPSGTTVSFNPDEIEAPGSGNSTMTITVGSSTPTGTYPITVTGNGGGIQQTTTVTLTVTSPVLVSIAVTPVNPSIAAGKQQQFTAAGTYSDVGHLDLQCPGGRHHQRQWPGHRGSRGQHHHSGRFGLHQRLHWLDGDRTRAGVDCRDAGQSLDCGRQAAAFHGRRNLQ